MRKLLLLGVIAVSVFAGGGAVAAPRTDAVAAEPWEAPSAAAAPSVPALAVTPPAEIRGPSTFAMGLATLVGAGFLRWRRRRYLAATAAL